MAGINTIFKFAESQGLTIPEVVKFLASPAGYVVSKALDKIEYEAQLPSGLLSTLQNPTGAAADYVKTQAKNAVFDENNPSQIENIISQLRGDNESRPNFVGPQTKDSLVSSQNLADLLATLNKTSNTQPDTSSTSVNTAYLGDNNPNVVNTVGPAAQSEMDSTPYSQDFLAMLSQYQQPEVAQAPASISAAEVSQDSNPVIDFGGTMDYSDYFGDRFGGGGGGKLMDSYYAHGGEVCGCKR